MWKFWKKEKEKEHYLLTTVPSQLSLGEIDQLRQYREECHEYNQRHNMNISLNQWIQEREGDHK